MRRILLVIVWGFFISLYIYAQKVFVGDFSYTLEDSTATVVECTYTSPGNIEVPENIIYAGKEYTVTSVGKGAFSGKYAIRTLKLPSTIVYIGDGAFSYCTRMSSLNIPDSVSYIGANAFSMCLELDSIVIPEKITTIGDGTFSACNALTSINIPSSVTTIGNSAFVNCNHLADVHISDIESWLGIDFGNDMSNPLSNGGNLIVDGVALHRLIIPDYITEIKPYAFQGCNSLVTVTFPEGIQSIGNEAFSGSSLQRAIFPTVESYLGLHYDSYSSKVTYRNNCKIYINSNLYNPQVVDWPESLTKVPEYVFHGNTTLKGVNLPSTVTEIGKFAFQGSGLTSIIIPNSVTTICERAFSGCSYLTKVTFGDNVSSIGYAAFTSCGMTSLSLPEALVELGGSAFQGCSQLRDVTIGNSLKIISDLAFYDCKLLNSVTFGDSIISIGKSAFEEIYNLGSVTLPNSLIAIKAEAFYGTSINSLTMGGSVRYIGSNAFNTIYSTTNVSYVNIPDIERWSQTELSSEKSNPFSQSGSLCVENDKVVNHLDLNLGNKTVKPYTFYGASKLRTIRIKAATVDKHSFEQCSNVNKIYLDADSIGASAFGNCQKITAIYCPRAIPPVAFSNSFSKYEGVKLYVPKGSIGVYENDDNCWFRFLDIYECDFSKEEMDKIFGADYVSGIEDVIADETSDNSPVEIYNLNGVKIATSTEGLAPGLYIRRQGDVVTKVLVK